MPVRYPVMVLGGYGVFGSRICRRLAKDSAIRVIIVGRSSRKAEGLAAEIRAETPEADVTGLAVNVPNGLSPAIAAVKPKLVIHACGPFQGQGYDVPEICIGQGVHYVDLADDRAFVAGFHTLSEMAAGNGVLAVSGASTVPGLSSAVIEHLRPDFSRMRRISIGIATGSRAPRGPAVTAAVLSYTGKPVPCWRNGRWTRVHGWQDLRRRNIQGPKIGALGNRWFAACDIPDLVLFPETYPELETVTFHAGMELSLSNFGLWSLSWPVRLGLIPSLAPAAAILQRIARVFDIFGGDRGGMFIEVAGDGPDNAPIRRTWNLIAGAGDGPWIPCMPAVILTRKLARDAISMRGASPCINLITLQDFEEATAGFDIEFDIV